MDGRIVIVGAGHAGGTAAALLRQQGWTGPVTLVGEEPIAPYQRQPLSKAWLKGEAGGYDLVIRRAEFLDSGMAARDLGAELRHAMVASTDYLAAHGTPASPQDLAAHRCIQWRPAGGETQRWRFEVGGEPLTLPVAGPLIVSHCDVAIAGALQGVGVAYVLETYAAPSIQTGGLVPLLSEFLPPFGG